MMQNTYKFKYGNIFEGEKITESNYLQKILQIKPDQELRQENIEQTIKEKKLLIEKKLRSETYINTIYYWDQKVYFDVHLVKDKFSKTDLKLQKNIKLPSDIKNKWIEYEQRLSEAMELGITGQDSNDGHWISQYKNAQVIENYFIEIAYTKVNLLKKVALKSFYYEDRLAADYLLHWGEDKSKITKFLLICLNKDSDHSVHNYIVRALTALSNKVSFTEEDINKLQNILYHPSSFCINKGLMILLSISEKNPEIITDANIKKRIENLTVAVQPHINEPAKSILKNLKVIQ